MKNFDDNFQNTMKRFDIKLYVSKCIFFANYKMSSDNNSAIYSTFLGRFTKYFSTILIE